MNAPGDDGDVAARGGQVERLDDEVVVDVAAVRVVYVVVDGVVAERHVADGGGERTVVGERCLEAVVADLLAGVEVVGDLGGDRVEFDADHLHSLGR
ncbi:hypothetical protein GS440_19540 [Rhodococcus hoagii]|nr:hypothetical protein [Prescottella equi]